MTTDQIPDHAPQQPATRAARPTGPHWPAIVLGLVCVAIAALALGQGLERFDVDWGNLGPLGIVAVGGILVLVGMLGLLGRRRDEPGREQAPAIDRGDTGLRD